MSTMTRGRWALAVLPIALAIGCGTSSGPGSVSGDEGVIASQQATPSPALKGTLELTSGSDGLTVMGTVCTGIGGYSDISPGASVTLTNETGTVIGTTSLEGGTTKNAGDATVTCDFTFSFGSVPKAKFYAVEVSHRGKITESASEVKANGDAFDVTLGS